jgi:hypothetical protein
MLRLGFWDATYCSLVDRYQGFGRPGNLCCSSTLKMDTTDWYLAKKKIEVLYYTRYRCHITQYTCVILHKIQVSLHKTHVSYYTRYRCHITLATGVILQKIRVITQDTGVILHNIIIK